MCTHSGKWPTSWDDLARVPPDRNHPSFRWPDEIGEIRKRIRINFDVTTAQVIARGKDHFTAVEQTGPNYGPHEGFTYPFFYAMENCDK